MKILQGIWGVLPSGLVFFCTVLSLAIPWGVYRINRKFHQYGDPPWKTKEDSEIE